MNEYCPNYVGVSCVDGTCPVARADDFEEYSIPVGFNCDECWLYKGCEDCVLYGTDDCDEWRKKQDDREK